MSKLCAGERECKMEKNFLKNKTGLGAEAAYVSLLT